MPYRCCGIIGCRNVGNTSVHQFPKNDPYRSQWCDSVGKFFNDCGIPWCGPKAHTSICEHHFGPQCFSRDPDLVRGKEKHRIRLKRDAVPTIFEQPDVKVINKHIKKCQAKQQEQCLPQTTVMGMNEGEWAALPNTTDAEKKLAAAGDKLSAEILRNVEMLDAADASSSANLEHGDNMLEGTEEPVSHNIDSNGDQAVSEAVGSEKIDNNVAATDTSLPQKTASNHVAAASDVVVAEKVSNKRLSAADSSSFEKRDCEGRLASSDARSPENVGPQQLVAKEGRSLVGIDLNNILGSSDSSSSMDVGREQPAAREGRSLIGIDLNRILASSDSSSSMDVGRDQPVAKEGRSLIGIDLNRILATGDSSSSMDVGRDEPVAKEGRSLIGIDLNKILASSDSNSSENVGREQPIAKEGQSLAGIDLNTPAPSNSLLSYRIDRKKRPTNHRSSPVDRKQSNKSAAANVTLCEVRADKEDNITSRISSKPKDLRQGGVETVQGVDLESSDSCVYTEQSNIVQSKFSMNGDVYCVNSQTVSDDEDGDVKCTSGLDGDSDEEPCNGGRQLAASSPVCISSEDSHQSNEDCMDQEQLKDCDSDIISDTYIKSGDCTPELRTPSPDFSQDHSQTTSPGSVTDLDRQSSNELISGKRTHPDSQCESIKNTGVGRVPMLGNIKVDLTLPAKKKQKRKRTGGVSNLTSTYQPLQNPYTQAHRKYLQPATSPPKPAAKVTTVPTSPVRPKLKLPSWSSSKLPTSPFRGPPTVKVLLRELNPMITCFICKGYIVNAITLTECLHSFCRSCIIRHAYESLLCPVCKIMIHPSNPFQNMRADSTMQDIVHKLVPRVEKDELRREEKFYTSRGIAYPLLKDVPPEPSAKKPLEMLTHGMPTWISILLEHAGTAPGCGPHRTLCKPYLRAPLASCVYHLMRLLCRKLTTPQHCKVVLFVDDYLLHESLTLEEVWDMFFLDETPKPDIMHLQFGVVPDRDFFNDKNFKMSEEPMEEFTYGVCAQEEEEAAAVAAAEVAAGPDEYLDEHDVDLFRHQAWMTS